MTEGLLILFTGWAIGATLYTIHWVRAYVERQRREIEDEVRQALVDEWKFMVQHLDNWTTTVDNRIADALSRQWDNGVKSRRP